MGSTHLLTTSRVCPNGAQGLLEGGSLINELPLVLGASAILVIVWLKPWFDGRLEFIERFRQLPGIVPVFRRFVVSTTENCSWTS